MENKLKIKPEKSSIKWDVKQRLTLLESTVYWNGGLRTNSLVETFGISRVQASKDFTLYQELCPENLRYDKHKKCYLITEQFKPAFMEGSVSEYLQFLHAARGNVQGPVVPLVDKIASGVVVEPVSHQLSTDILQGLVQSIQNGEELEMVYRTMSRLKTVSHVLCPHNFVFDGLHWYVRGYSYTHEEFRNFLLVRIQDIKITGKADFSEADDAAWNTDVHVKLGAHPGLTTMQKSVIESDYGMENGILSYPTRAALVASFLNAMRIGLNDSDAEAVSHPLVLLNRDELDRYLAA